MADFLYHRAKYGGDRALRGGCRQKSVFLRADLIWAQRSHAGIAFTQLSKNEFLA